MANNYTQFSELITGITKKEKEWIELALADYSGEFNDSLEPSALFKQLPDDIQELYKGLHEESQEDYLDFQWDLTDKGKTLWLYAAESGDPSRVAAFVQAFLTKFRPNDTFSLSWASWCDKLRASEFNGGSILVTADWCKWYNDSGIMDLAGKYREAKLAGKSHALKDLT